MTPPPAVGDLVAFRVTQVAREFAMRKAKVISNYQRLGAAPLPSAPEVGSLNFTITADRNTNESRLVGITMRPVTSNTFDGGTRGYGTLAFQMLPTATLRMPASVDVTEDLRAGCTVTTVGPVWYTSAVGGHVSVFAPSDVVNSSCPAPAFVDAGSPAPSVVLVGTSRYMDPASPSNFRVLERGGGLTQTITGVSQPAPQTYLLNVSMQPGREYDLFAGSPGPSDTRGVPVPPGPPVPFVAGGCQTPTPLVISAVGVAGTTDFVELHNRSRAPLSLGGWQLAWRLSSGASGNQNLNGTIPAGGYFLLSSGGGDQPLGPNLDQNGGWLGIGQGLPGGCSTGSAADWMGWGSGACVTGYLPSGPSGYRRNDVFGCIDTDQPSDWLTTAPAPRRLTSMPQPCVCP